MEMHQEAAKKRHDELFALVKKMASSMNSIQANVTEQQTTIRGSDAGSEAGRSSVGFQSLSRTMSRTASFMQDKNLYDGK